MIRFNVKRFTNNFRFQNLKNFADTNTGKGSILKGKNQVGENDKSYSGTSSRNTYGSDRVLEEVEKKGLIGIQDDSSIHKHPNLNIIHKQQKTDKKEENEFFSESNDDKNKQKQKSDNKTTVKDKQESF